MNDLNLRLLECFVEGIQQSIEYALISREKSCNDSDPPALRHHFMNIDDPAGTPTMSDNLTRRR